MENLSFNSNISCQSTKSRTIYDVVHGHIILDKYVWDFIDTPEFQRLRNLKQLGNTHYIFPSATHSRFEHSIGVAYLSNKLINHLSSESNFEKTITLAGLCHDLGHGPFSHLFDRGVLKTLEY